MYEHVRAVFQQGVFRPVTPCAFPENSELDLMVGPAVLAPPQEQDSAKRKEIRCQLIQLWNARTLAPNAPRLTRDQLHERD
ncbi:MAG: antitoxin family protein [Pirellulales bacterium]|nr:antitoxin family protein [Pirellulales bacterium]